MNNNIEIAPYAPLLVYKKGYTAKFVFDTIKENNLQGLRIFAYLQDTRLSSLDFLREYGFLESLHINSVDDFDFDFLKHLPNLKELSLGVEGNNMIDFSGNTCLERLYINWRKNIAGIEESKNLKIFSLYGYKEKDLMKFKDLTGLTKLIIKTCSIEALKGMRAMANLEQLIIVNCKKLKTAENINGLSKLNYLEFNTCPVIRDFSPMDNLPGLETLYLTDCKQVDSIKFIDNLPSLNEFGLLGNTDVVDGDMFPAKRVKRLIYNHRKHYNIKIDTPEADEISKKNIEVIKKSFGV